ncbi:MAG: serpin family protein [Elusimicrobia bacterium]|nr:serpin family protein [Elusimicrobiota bacterium]
MPPASASPIAETVNDFTCALFAQLSREKSGNLFLSPYCALSALAMTYAGAAGVTEREMRRALRLRLTGESLHAGLGRLAQGLRELGGGGAVQLVTADALWLQTGFPLEAAFVETLRRLYGAQALELDFRADPEGAGRRINSWAEELTRGKIRDLIPPGGVTEDTRLALTNAVYLKAPWAAPFMEEATEESPFILADGNEVPAPLMRQTESFGLHEDAGLQCLELAYAGGALSMLVLLPRRADGLTALEASFTAERLAELTARLEPRRVAVALPRFKLTSGFSLAGALGALGMPSAFRLSATPGPGDADFSGATGRRDLFIGSVVQKAFVAVDEAGTEAAAATAALLAELGMPAPGEIPVFRADHPFLFLIRDRRSGAVLFIGRLADPSPAG